MHNHAQLSTAVLGLDAGSAAQSHTHDGPFCSNPSCIQVDLYCECPLWPDDGMCSLRDCSVCECEEQEVPEPWRKAEAVEACDSEWR